MKELKILRVKDKLDKFGVKKTITPNLSHRALFIAKSGVGKSNLIVNLLLRAENEFYRDDFDGDNIFLISPSINSDDKLRLIVEQKDIPDCNVYDCYDTQILMTIYETIKKEYMSAVNDKQKPPNFLIIIDDCADSLKCGGRSNPLEKLYIAGRHYNITVWTTSQYYTSVPPVVRNNTNVLYVWNTSYKEIHKIAEEFSDVKTDEFIKQFRESTGGEKHNFMVIDTTRSNEEKYKNHNFEIVSF